MSAAIRVGRTPQESLRSSWGFDIHNSHETIPKKETSNVETNQ